MILEAFIWGAGTAIGELPPYFIARAASMAGSRSDECDEVLNELEEVDKKDKTLMDKMKALMVGWLKKNAFVTVLIAASVSIR